MLGQSVYRHFFGRLLVLVTVSEPNREVQSRSGFIYRPNFFLELLRLEASRRVRRYLGLLVHSRPIEHAIPVDAPSYMRYGNNVWDSYPS